MTKLSNSKVLNDQNILDLMIDPIFIKNRQHQWVYANGAMSKLLGRPVEELLGKTDADFVPFNIYPEYWAEDDKVIATGEDSHKEEDVHEEGHPPRRVLTRKSRIESDGEYYIFGVIRDITELSRTGRLTQLGEIAASLSHELMTPLTIMDFQLKNFADRLEDGDLTSKETETFLANIEKSKNRLLGIIKSVRAFAQNHADMPMLPISLQDIVYEAIDIATPRLTERQVSVRPTSSIPSLRVMCRGPQLSQILINLLHNAADAVALKPEASVRLEYEVAADWVEIAVIDTGNGIPPEIATKLMTPFFTTKPSHAGTGLGLSLAAKIATEHGGSLRYDNRHPNTCFRLRLPLAD